MSIFAFLSLISAIIIFLLGIIVFHKNKKSASNRIFLFLCTAASFWAFSEFMLRQSESVGSAFFWMKLTAFWTFVPALLFHFILIFTRRGKWQGDWWIYPVLYVPAAVFCGFELFTGLITTVPAQKYWGYTYGYSTNLWPFYIEMVWGLGLSLCALALCLQYYTRTTRKRERLQAKYIATGVGIPTLAGMITEVIFPFCRIW